MRAIGVRLLHCGSVGLDANNGVIATLRANSRSPPFARLTSLRAIGIAPTSQCLPSNRRDRLSWYVIRWAKCGASPGTTY